MRPRVILRIQIARLAASKILLCYKKMELEEPETDHTCTIDYNSKLEMKKTRSWNPGLIVILNIDVYYQAKYGSLCSFTAETFST